MSDRDRALFYLGGLVAVFVLAYFLGSALAPAVLDQPSPPQPSMSRMPHG